MSDDKKILFVCVENSARSQMAEGFFQKYSKKFQAFSAGTEPNSKLNSMAVQAMKEIGIDIVKQKPKILSDEMIQNSLKVVNMGCMNKESCPSLYVKDVIDWNISDPKDKTMDEVRKIRDQIKLEVLGLIKKLEDDA